MTLDGVTWERAARWTFALAAVGLLGGALGLRATSYGDGGEYHLMAESLLRHGTPDVRAGDVRSLAGREVRYGAGIDFAMTLTAYFEARTGRWYSYHFWGYSLLTVPARAVLRLLQQNDLKSLQVTNALAFLLALHQVLWSGAFRARAGVLVAWLAALSPAVWFVLWAQPESFCFALVLLGLVWARAGRRYAPILCVALAAMQNPPLVLLVIALWVEALRTAPDARARARAILPASLAALPVVWPFAFFEWRFGVPSVIARESTNASLASLRRVYELFFDLNLGLAPYAPLVVALFILSLARRGGRLLGAGRVLLLAAMAYACSVTANWNHGTSGPSRYTIWMLPVLLVGIGEADEAWGDSAGAWPRRSWRVLAAAAVAVQLLIVAGRGGLVQPPDFLSHSYAARFVLRHRPAWYNPSPEIFVPRTNGTDFNPEAPAVYMERAECRKVWVRPAHARLLMDACGRLPDGSAEFWKPRTDRRLWRYFEY
jgi:hypothetical protein